MPISVRRFIMRFRVPTSASARGASKNFIARNLQLEPGSPVAVVEQIAFLDNGMPFEYSFSTHKADLFDFSAVIVKKIP